MRHPAIVLAALGLSGALLTAGCAMTATPLTPEELSDGAADKLMRVTAGQEPLNGKVTLADAIERALKYNLDHHVEVFERSLRTAELSFAHYNLLPSAVANAGYAERDDDNASSSLNLVTGRPNFGFSTSTDKRLHTADLSFSWHVLDFGLSIVRARQAADRVLMAEEARRKVVHRLLEDVRTAYWRAWTAQTLHAKLRRIEERTKRALSASRRQASDGTTSPITATTYRRELIEIQRTLRELQRDLSVAKFQLSALMNVKPGSSYTLASPEESGFKVPRGGMRDIIQVALENRAELRDVVYRQRINAHEADAALLELIPGIQLYAGPNFDSNSFLLHDQWLSWGAKASWNLIKVFQYPARREVIEAQDELLDRRALALTMAIMTQVYVSNARLWHFHREEETARDYHRTQQELVGYIRREHDAGRVSEQTLLREELNAIVGHVRYNLARSAVEGAKANLVASIGLDPKNPVEPEFAAARAVSWHADVRDVAAARP